MVIFLFHVQLTFIVMVSTSRMQFGYVQATKVLS